MCNPFKKFFGKKTTSFPLVFDQELRTRLLNFGDKKLKVNVRRQDGKDVVKDLTGQEIIDTFGAEFEMTAFSNPGCHLILEPKDSIAFCLRGLALNTAGHGMKFLGLIQIRE